MIKVDSQLTQAGIEKRLSLFDSSLIFSMDFYKVGFAYQEQGLKFI